MIENEIKENGKDEGGERSNYMDMSVGSMQH